MGYGVYNTISIHVLNGIRFSDYHFNDLLIVSVTDYIIIVDFLKRRDGTVKNKMERVGWRTFNKNYPTSVFGDGDGNHVGVLFTRRERNRKDGK